MRYCSFVILFAIVSSNSAGQTTRKISREKARELVMNLLANNRIVDGHSDFYHRYYTCPTCPRDIDDYPLDKIENGNTNIPLYRNGGVGGQLYNVYGKDRNMLNLME